MSPFVEVLPLLAFQMGAHYLNLNSEVTPTLDKPPGLYTSQSGITVKTVLYVLLPHQNTSSPDCSLQG